MADTKAGTIPDDIMGLVDYMKEKKREACPVCKLPEFVREQLALAKEKKITRRDQLEWLDKVVHADISNRDLDAHYSGRHDEP